MSTAGQQREFARYELPSGEIRRLVGQRIDGRVAVSDQPAGEDGRVYLVERHVESVDEMDGLIAAYVSDSTERGEPAILVPRDIGAADARD